MTTPAALHWINAPCDGCGSLEARLLFEGPDLLMDLPGRFRLVRCPQCGLIRQSPHLSWDSLKDYYPEEYSPYKKIIASESSVWRRFDRRYGLQKRVRFLEAFQAGGRLLDVGCGTGVFLGELKRTGRWELMGIEPSPSAAAYVQEALGVEVLPSRFSEVQLPDNSFDVVTMWNVLEHLETPITDLRRAASLIKPGGWLALAFPNVDGLGARIFGPYWMGWDLPRHLYLFPLGKMRTLLEELGFEWKSVRCLAGGHASFGLSARFWLKGTGRWSRAAGVLLKIYASFPVRLALSPVFWIAALLHQTSLISIIVQKKPSLP